MATPKRATPKKKKVQTGLTDEQLEQIALCQADPFYFIRTYCKITHELQGLIPFNMHPYQEEMVQAFLDHRRNIILKARQLGISTIVAAYALWVAMFNDYKTIGIAATDEETAINLADKVNIAYQYLPPWMKRACYKTTDNVQKMQFVNGSVIMATTTTKKTFRGKSLSLLIIDEAAHIELIDKLWVSARPTLSTGGSVIALSSPNGVGNWFYEQYTKAERGENKFNPIKLMWWVNPTYTKEWFERETADMKPEEVAQEYECSFVGSSATFLSGQILEKLATQLKNEPEPNKMGDEKEFWVWQPYDPKHDYIMAADIARGDYRDYSVCHVIDVTTMNQVAEFRGKVPLEQFGLVMKEIGELYGSPLAVVESNTFGYTVVKHMENEGYKNVYYSQRGVAIPEEFVERRWMSDEEAVPGFIMSETSRKAILAKMEMYIRKEWIHIHSIRLLQELNTFVIKNMKPQATKGTNDDLVMALAFGLFILELRYGMYEGRYIEKNKGLSKEEAVAPIYMHRTQLPMLEDFQANSKNRYQKTIYKNWGWLLKAGDDMPPVKPAPVPQQPMVEGEEPVEQAPAEQPPPKKWRRSIFRG
jgi:hypothetical protein